MKRKSVLGYGPRNGWHDRIKLHHSSYYKIVLELSPFVMCYIQQQYRTAHFLSAYFGSETKFDNNLEITGYFKFN